VAGHVQQGPLSGIKVIELATVVMVPFAGQLLGDMGADVIKVEGENIDSARVLGEVLDEELSGVALNLLRNKRSIRLDLKAERGRDAVLRLLDTADVFITNLRPGALARLGLGHETVLPGRRHLVYCEAHGFRAGSGEAERPAFDDIIQAETGMTRMGERAGMDVRFIPSVIADKLTGLYIALAVLGALVHRAATGEGQRVEVPMFDSVLSFNLVEHLAGATTPGGSTGYSRIMSPHRRPHKTKDGYLAVLPYSDRDWRALYEAVGRERELDDAPFVSHRQRLENPDRVYESLATVIAQRTTQEWLELCRELGVAASPVPSLDEIANDTAKHRGVLEPMSHPVVGDYRSINPPIRFEASPMSVRRAAPLVGQHTIEVLQEAGFDPVGIKRLLDDGAAIQSSRSVGNATHTADGLD
jgi:crotonobetainyl-CoA:carnitine CoA-transferase CaiB-like acyl-CoA transferase